MMLTWLFRKPTQNDLKNKAYQIYSEWGAKLRVPREQRLADKFPQINEQTIIDWLVEFRAIKSEIGLLLEKGNGTNSYSFNSFSQELLKSFPFLNRKSLRMAWSEAIYVSHHEGYNK